MLVAFLDVTECGLVSKEPVGAAYRSRLTGAQVFTLTTPTLYKWSRAF